MQTGPPGETTKSQPDSLRDVPRGTFVRCDVFGAVTQIEDAIFSRNVEDATLAQDNSSTKFLPQLFESFLARIAVLGTKLGMSSLISGGAEDLACDATPD